MAVSPVLIIVLLELPVSKFPSYEDPSYSRLGPAPRTQVLLNPLIKGPFSKYSHILQSWG